MKPTLSTAVRVPASAVLLFAGVAKVIDPAHFQEQLLTYPFLTYGSSALIASAFPWWEIIIGTAVWVPCLRQASAIGVLATACLFLLLHAWLGYAMPEASCGCFVVVDMSPAAMLAVDAAILAAGFVLWRDARPGLPGGINASA
jgi:Methylamine utilisation protein MauE